MRRAKRLNVPRDDGRRSLAKEYVMDGLSRFTTGQYSENLPAGFMLGYVLDGDVKYVASSVQAKINEHREDIALVLHPRRDIPIGNATRFYSRHRRRSNGGEIEVQHALVLMDLVAWIIPKDVLSWCFSTLGVI